MTRRAEVRPTEAELKGRRVTRVDFAAKDKGHYEEWAYVVIHFDNGSTLYADNPTLYIDPQQVTA